MTHLTNILIFFEVVAAAGAPVAPAETCMPECEEDCRVTVSAS